MVDYERLRRHATGLTQLPLLPLLLLLVSSTVAAQSISTSTSIPPLQWINLTGLLGGSSAAPPLKDASIGYDEASRNLLIFGGESAQGFPQSQTYLLNLDSLMWTVPSPPANLVQGPPARSAAIFGDDIAASYRHGHVVIGGKGTNGEALSDIWEFDYISQFWSQMNLSPGGPSPRWGAVGGSDPRAGVVQDPRLSYPNTSFYLAGGYDGKNGISLSDVWRLNVSGALSSNLPNYVTGSWEKVSIEGSALPAKVDPAGIAVYQSSQQRLISVGGCTSSSAANDSCAEGDSYIINVGAQNTNAPAACPAPRVGASLARNLNGASSSFGSQVFLLLGTFNTSLWDDGGGLGKGEVDILDVNTGTWARVLPAGDPGGGGTPAFPSPREGAAVLSLGQQFVGSSRSSASDIVVFGGRDASGNYLSEMWILRAYNGAISSSNQKWSGYGNGRLQSGVDANGAGVTVQYMTSCATAIKQPNKASSSSSPSGPTTTSTGPDATGSTKPVQPPSNDPYDTSTIHKTLAPVSVALFMPALLFYRLAQPSASSYRLPDRTIGLFYLSVVIAIVAFGLGVGGLATAFTSLKSTSSLTKRSVVENLSTRHGRAGIALFIGLYGLVPLLVIMAIFSSRDGFRSGAKRNGRQRANSTEAAEKLGLYQNRAGSPTRMQPLSDNDPPEAPPPTPPPRRRVRSWGHFGHWPGSHTRKSSETVIDSVLSPAPSTLRSFEVTNRPRARHASANSLAAFSDPRPSVSPRNLSGLSWMERRRSLNTIGDIDYALTQLNRRGQDSHPPTPGTAALELRSTQGLMQPSAVNDEPLHMPGYFDILIHLLLHASLLGLSILSLVALWQHAPIAPFSIFIVWTAAFYCVLVAMSWNGIPRDSILTVILSRLRAPVRPVGTPTNRPPSSNGLDDIPFPADVHSPYQHHRPAYRAALDTEYPASLDQGPTAEDDDDDIDEDTRQRRIEEEMSRRDVSIVTVPKRKLFLTNPEPS